MVHKTREKGFVTLAIMEVYYLVFLLSIFWHGCHGINWSLPPNSQKCLKEELHANVLVAGEYDVTEAAGQRVDYIVSCMDNLCQVVPLLSLIEPRGSYNGMLAYHGFLVYSGINKNTVHPVIITRTVALSGEL